MKKIILLFSLCILISQARAQVATPEEVLKKLKENQPIENQPMINASTSKDDEENKKHHEENDEQLKDKKDDDSKNNQKDAKKITKYEFIAGDQILFFDDFSNPNIEETLHRWKKNTNCEIIDAKTSPRLKINSDGFCSPELNMDFTDKYSVEFEIQTEVKTGKSLNNSVDFFIANTSTKTNNPEMLGAFGIKFAFGKKSLSIISYSNNKNIFYSKVAKNMDLSEKHKIAIWRQNDRFKIFIDNEKVLDTTNVLPPGAIPNDLMFSASKGTTALVSNVIVSNFSEDIRDRIFGQGRFTFYNVRFADQSATIKPECIPALREIAEILKENPGERFKIICYFEENGDAEQNMEITAKRAENIQMYFIKNCKMDKPLINTECKGSNERQWDRAINSKIELVREQM